MTFDAVLAAASGLTGVALGAVVTAVLGDWRDRRREARVETQRARADETRRDLEAIVQTRRRAHVIVEQLRELAVRPKAWQHLGPYELANDTLIGDPEVVRAYRELLIDLQTRFGKGMPTAAVRQSVRVLARIDHALADQERRVRQGKVPELLNEDLAEDLFDVDAFADRLLAIDQPPTLGGRLARLMIDAMRLRASIRRRRQRRIPPRSRPENHGRELTAP